MILRRGLLLLALLAVPSGAAGEACAPDVREHLSTVRRQILSWQLAAARVSLEDVRAAAATDCRAAILRLEVLEALLWLNEGRLSAADERLRSLELLPDASPELTSDYLYGVAAVAYELGQYRRAREYYRRQLAIAQANEDPRRAAVDLYNIAATYLAEAPDEEQREAVAERFREALAIAVEAQNEGLVAAIHIELGKLLDGDEGRRHLERGLELAVATERETTALGALAVDRLRDDPAAARQRLDRAGDLAEQALEEEGNPWPFLHLWLDGLPVLWATSPVEVAIREIDAVLRRIEDLRRRQGDDTAEAGFFSVWAEIYQQFAGYLLREQQHGPAFAAMERYRARVLADRLAAAGASAAPTSDLEAVVSLPEAAAALSDREALLAFQIAPWRDVYGRFGGGSWLMVIRNDGTHVYRLPERGALESRIRLFLGLVAQRGELGGAAARLYQDLLEPALVDLPATIDRLILIPDGELHRLPFGTLRAASNGAPVAARYQLSTVPSASLWLRWRRAAPAAVDPALVFAAPRPGGVAASVLRASLGPLPFAAEEGRRIVEQVENGSQLRLGVEASESSLQAIDLDRFGVLHFAAHAVVDDVHPERSAVLLAPGDGADGELRPSEIAALDLSGRIVVLSACRSASGGILEGEGVMGLARAFFQAGALAVVGSLWPLDDREAQRFFEIFYRELTRGHSVRAALSGAQAELRTAGAPAAAWAGVVVLGDGARQPLPSRTGSTVASGIVAFVLLTAALILVGARRRQTS